MRLRTSCFFHGLILLSLAVASGCGDDACEGDCVCHGSECQCPDTGDCSVDCASECDLSCTGSGDCDFVCGDDCLATCPGSGRCLVDVGGGSSVECTGSGNCDVFCHGDCTLACPGSGDCILRCAEDADCNMERCSGGVIECPDGVLICGDTCR